MNRFSLDVECYRNYILVQCKLAEEDYWYEYEMLNGNTLQGTLEDLQELVSENAVVTFNGFGYDHAMVSGVLSGFDHDELFQLSQHLVKGDQLTPWRVWKDIPGLMRFDFKIHIDLMAISPLVASLKMYGARIGFKKIQELPIDWRSTITMEDRNTMLPYCRNDVEVTEHLYNYLRPQVLLRKDLGSKYEMDLYQKSDAQIAEAVIKKELKDIGINAKGGTYKAKSEYMYTAPEWLSFDTPELQDQLVAVQEAKFKMQTNGKFKLPSILEKPLKIFGHSFQMGSGGLHSQEANRTVVAHTGWELSDIDVASYYPMMILNNGYAPENFKDEFLEVYRKIVDARISAKRSGDKTAADSLKIVINSSFGKFGNKYSAIFSPSLLIHTTLTGQLLLLKLIEMMADRGIDVVNANTDGIVCYFPSNRRGDFEKVWKDWEKITDLELEETKYKSLHSIHVNNYCAIKPDGSVKGKADFAPAGFDVPSPFGLQKNPQSPIINEAVKAHLSGSGHYIDVIKRCTDPFMFCFLRKVGGGCEFDMTDVGGTIRWYIGTERRLPMTYIKSGNNVPNTANGVIANELPESLPEDLNIDYYIKAAYDMLQKVKAKEPYEYQGLVPMDNEDMI